MEPTPTADLDRTNDKVYDCTTSVVRAVMSLSQGNNALLEAKKYIYNSQLTLLKNYTLQQILSCKKMYELQVFNRARLISI